MMKLPSQIWIKEFGSNKILQYVNINILIYIIVLKNNDITTLLKPT
jgi:hypothetical protein